VKFLLCRLIGVLTASVLLVSGVQASGFQFRLIADSSGPFSGTGLAAINASGTVTFSANSDTGQAIYTGNGGPLTLIADSTESSPFYGIANGAPRINAGGTVVFKAVSDSFDKGLYVGNGGPTTPVITEDTSGLRGFGGFSINDSGTVAFGASEYIPYRDVSGVYTMATNGTVTKIADASGPISGFGETVIDANGTVTFVAGFGAGGQAIVSGSGGPLTTIVDTTGPFDNFLSMIGMSSTGAIAFAADVDSGGRGVFLAKDGGITTIVDPNDPAFSSIDDRLSVNADDAVVFQATLASGEDGLFLADDGSIRPVILDGQMLDGKEIVAITTFNDQAINDSGEIAFWAYFDDHPTAVYGSTGVYVAFVPIPAAAWLFGSALGLLGWLKRRTA